MSAPRRLLAVTLTLVLALFPVALEHCRSVCVAASQPTPGKQATNHQCHDATATDDSSARMDPLARGCAHGDQAQTYDLLTVVTGKSRTFALTSAVPQVAGERQVDQPSLRGTWPDGRVSLSRAHLPRHSPLRL